MDSNRIIRLPELKNIIGIHNRSTLLRWENEGTFPKRIKIGKRAIGWILKDIEDWIEKKRS